MVRFVEQWSILILSFDLCFSENEHGTAAQALLERAGSLNPHQHTSTVAAAAALIHPAFGHAGGAPVTGGHGHRGYHGRGTRSGGFGRHGNRRGTSRGAKGK